MSSRLAPTSPKSPRKAPTCTKCGRPRAGHQRRGCPFIDSPSSKPESRASAKSITSDDTLDAQDDQIVDDPEVLILEKAEMVDTPRRRRSSVKPAAAATLQSLCTEENAVLDNLLIPGMMTPSIDKEEVDRNVARWRQKLPESAPKAAAKPSSSRGVAKVGSPSSKGKSVRPRTTPLGRTSSMEERQAFVDRLANITPCTPAIVYVMPVSSIADMEREGQKVGFNTRTYVPPRGSDDAGRGLLIIGQDKAMVENIFASASTKADASDLGKCVASAVMGAAIIWTSLACS